MRKYFLYLQLALFDHVLTLIDGYCHHFHRMYVH